MHTSQESKKIIDLKKEILKNLPLDSVIAPLTDNQNAIYIACLQNVKSTMYNIPLHIKFNKTPDLNAAKLQKTINTVLKNHPILFSYVENIDNKPHIVGGEFFDACEAMQCEENELATLVQEFPKPFQFHSAPLFRAKLIETNENIHFLLDAHHIVFDGTCIALICKEIAAILQGEQIAQEQVNPFSLHILEENIKKSSIYEISKNYFNTFFAEIEVDSNLAPDNKPLDDEEKIPCKLYEVTLDEGLSAQKIQSFLTSHNITENTLFMTAFGYALAKMTGQVKSLFCAGTHDRFDKSLTNCVSMIAKTIPVYINFKDELDIKNTLRQVQDEFYATLNHSHYAFDDLSKEYNIKHDVLFTYQGNFLDGIHYDGQIAPLEIIETNSAMCNLNFIIFKKENKYQLQLRYRSDIYEKYNIENFVNIFINILHGFFDNDVFKNIVLVNKNELELLEKFNDTLFEYDKDSTIIDLLKKQTKTNPSKIAVVYKDKQLSYKDINSITDNIANYIIDKGLKNGEIVSILIGRNEFMPIAAIGVLKAGMAYQPLDASYPVDRIEFMMNDAQTKLLIVDDELCNLVPSYAGIILKTCDIYSLQSGELTTPKLKPDNIFALLYTSGSTGTPKGCMLTHKNINSFVASQLQVADMSVDSVSAAFASFGFDANFMDMYPVLCAGGQLHIIAEDIRLDLDKLEEYYIKHSVSHSFMTTQVGRQFVAHLHKIPSIKWFATGGEALLPIVASGDCAFYNIYGPTECTVYATCFKVNKLYDPVPIGKPVNNLKLYIIDSYKRLLPRGAIGELCIAGPQVSLGYLGRDEITAQVFTKNIFCNDEEYLRLYHTGDLVRMLEDGNIEFVGRRDMQVKIRGFRIELTEVEGIIADYPGIVAATVIAKDIPSGGKGLFAYIVANKNIDIQDLNNFILDKKPPYMVPSAILQIDSIPLTPNQKVDKKKLPDITLVQNDESVSRNTLTRLERELIDIINKILGVSVDVSTSLRMAGLSSIDAIKLATELSKNYGFSPDVKTILKDLTVLQLEDAIVQHLLTQSPVEQDAKIYDKVPLSQTQLGIYLDSLNNTSAYTIPILVKLPNDLDIQKLKAAIDTAIKAHPSMLCAIKADKHGDPFMYPRPDFEYEIPIAPWQEGVMPAQTQFTFSDDALFCIRLFEAKEHIYLFFEIHHIIADGESVHIFLSDIDKAYAGQVLTSENYTMFDIALDEQKERKSAKYIEAKEYYHSILNGVSVDILPSRDVFDAEHVVKNEFNIIKNIITDIDAYCQKHKLTKNAFFTGAFALLLAKFSAQDEALFNVIYNGRNNPKSFSTLGMLVKTLPLYCDISLDISPQEFINSIENNLRKLKEYDIYSFAEASSEYNIKNDILFAYQDEMLQNINFCGKTAEVLEIEANATKALLNIDVFKQKNNIKIIIEYDGALYSKYFIQFFLQAYEACIINLLYAASLSEVSVLDAKSKSDNENKLKLLHDTSWSVDYRPAYRLLQDSAENFFEDMAVVANGEKLSYKELNIYANKLGNVLVAHGVKVNDIVALMLERSKFVYITRQGILKSGGAFLSIDPTYPDERVDFIVKDSGTKVLVITKDIYAQRKDFIDGLGLILCFVDDAEHLALADGENLNIAVPADALAYCIYTSGSTGKPKGVMITQKNLINFVDNNPKNHEILGYTEYGKVSLALASITFDVSIMEEFIPLAHGLSICMATLDEIHNPLALRKLCLENKVDIISCTPSFLLNFVDIEEVKDVIYALKSIDFGAEVFPPTLYTKLRELNPNLYIMNGYGPTEATISCTMSAINQTKQITIGKPNANVKVFMVDAHNNILPMGAFGEMVILGEGVGKGYINRQELTDTVFTTFWDMPAYKSGDFARLLPSGEIEYRGRRDNQIKLRGLRVELGEIEAAINTFDSVKSSFVMVKSSSSGQYLVAYYTADKHIFTEDLKKYLTASLTEYMVPSVLIQIDTFPLTANNKIDKSKLPDSDYQVQQKEYVAPSNDIEEDFCEFFRRILSITQVSVLDNFFELGGTSLSASKLAVMAMAKSYPIVYADIFKNPTPQALAMLCLDQDKTIQNTQTTTQDHAISNSANLAYNTMQHIDGIEENTIGDVVLTGVTGFLGIHILKSYLDNEDGMIYCLMRKGSSPTLEKRLASLLVYYFDNAMAELMAKRVICIEGDITDKKSLQQLEKKSFDTLINCAAIVKHFVHDDSLEKANVIGVKNLIELCRQCQKRLIHISTISIAGEGVDNVPPVYKHLHEHEFFIGQTLENAYIKSKFDAEKAMLEAIENGLDGKIMRVGNLMSRINDGEFQINSRTNGFMRQLKGYKILGKYPVSAMSAPAEFSPIDATAHAILVLSKTHERYTVFHPYNNHVIYMSDVIAAMNSHGFSIEIVSDTTFQEELMLALGDHKRSDGIEGLLTYLDNSSIKKHVIDGNNNFTTEALYRLGFLWPITDMQYLERTFTLLDDFGFFD